MEENLIRRLMSSIKCAVCGQHYVAHDINILGQEEEFWFLRVSCSACQTECLVAVAIAEGTAPELVTDLHEVDPEGLGDRLDLTADDMLDMHNFLKDFNGDFARLFECK